MMTHELPLVAIGVGNTTIRVGVTQTESTATEPAWSAQAEFPTDGFQPETLSPWLSAAKHRWSVASVQRAAEQRLAEWIRATRPDDLYHRLTFRDLPLQLRVQSPERVGMDRLVAAVAANRLRQPDRAAIVIDAGTAITVNLLSADGVFRGGVILPGFRLTAQALAEGTDLLPRIDADATAEPPPVIGTSPESAIRSGLFWGSVGAVREVVNRVTTELTSAPQVFVTGGDARRLASFVVPDAQFVPDLVLRGIWLAAS